MLEFLTIFLGLISGPQMVEVSVSEQVEAVELRLDGEAVARLEKPPWRARVELGDRLRPRVLEAVALVDGEEAHRVRQVLNLGVDRAQLRISLGPQRGDGSRPGRLVWFTADNVRPQRVGVELDGQPLELRSGRAFVLPPGSYGSKGSDEVHVLAAQADFPGGLVAGATRLLGGAYTDRVVTQLTALPVRLEDGAELPSAQGMGGWVQKDGEALTVAAADAPAAQIFVVRDVAGREPLAELGKAFRRSQARNLASLGEIGTVRLLDPRPEIETLEDGRRRDRYALSQRLTQGYGGLPHIVASYRPEGEDKFFMRAGTRPQRLADAVAVAGLGAAGSQGPRAVLLILGSKQVDDSDRAPEAIREYLRALDVPLRVWSVGRRGAPSPWGEAVDVSSRGRLIEAADALIDDVARQRVLWLEGEHFLHQLELSPRARGLRRLD